MEDSGLSFVSQYEEILLKLGNREPTTIVEARAVLENIRTAKGHLNEAAQRHLDNLSRDSCQRITRIISHARELEDNFIKSISEQLYSSKYRFIYELIQNADDSSYSKARAHGEPPFVRFIATPTTFVFETKEDGFTRANVDAICATDKSSKKASALDDHIGEKGFGFKSRFCRCQRG